MTKALLCTKEQKTVPNTHRVHSPRCPDRILRCLWLVYIHARQADHMYAVVVTCAPYGTAHSCERR